MEVAPFFVEFHNLRSFVAIYIMSRFTHFFRNFFLAKIAFSATSHVFCMYVTNDLRSGLGPVIDNNKKTEIENLQETVGDKC